MGPVQGDCTHNVLEEGWMSLKMYRGFSVVCVLEEGEMILKMYLEFALGYYG